ncbi:MAG: molybdopterin adenylyltransferase [Rhodobacteraceae bacterium]|nr:molybdopterin adenylyltransferase [Paracoccaceae bacterium]
MALIGVITVSDRASAGVYPDKSGPAMESWLGAAITTPFRISRAIIPDGAGKVADTLKRFCSSLKADLVLVSGGTGPALRDQTQEGLALLEHRELPGFGEAMRMVSLREVPTAILSRQTAAIIDKSLVITLPGKPSAIATCLSAVFPAVPYCLDLIGAARIETDPAICTAFRPA